MSAGLVLDHSAPLSARPLGATFGAELSGLRIAGDLPQAEVDAFLAALHRHGVVLLRGVPEDPGAQVAFSKRLGPLERHSSTAHTHPAHPEIFCVGNYEAPGGPKAHFATGVEQWHADSSFRPVPSRASLFYGAIVPPEGGETWFLDAVTAWAEMPPALQARIEGRRGVHDLNTLSEWNRRHTPGRPPLSAEARRQFPPVAQPLVRRHPVTGRRSLFVCPAVISHIEGMSAEDSHALIEEVMRHATQERYLYRHRWQAGDLVAWDNLATLHTATLFDHTRHVRLMFRTTVAGEA
ncbi:TauD/TfdA dioxygenase family protein [Paracraurococcus lichenis]|uniref:TauD/TfdA family dioxygenase n=1 Tax=Paracraurococcus lichenis TaxID=3064888 RepID=A0ABT9E3B5_9PROT|nr:TauD/TfdA family dioxygenase [Paracraurococcus sp. LOR1-02]MDO9710490.1 TauD/TfdA family dioxygenase [Paracraurococcus sp. LOR1-02]